MTNIDNNVFDLKKQIIDRLYQRANRKCNFFLALNKREQFKVDTVYKSEKLNGVFFQDCDKLGFFVSTSKMDKNGKWIGKTIVNNPSSGMLYDTKSYLEYIIALKTLKNYSCRISLLFQDLNKFKNLEVNKREVFEYMKKLKIVKTKINADYLELTENGNECYNNLLDTSIVDRALKQTRKTIV